MDTASAGSLKGSKKLTIINIVFIVLTTFGKCHVFEDGG